MHEIFTTSNHQIREVLCINIRYLCKHACIYVVIVFGNVIEALNWTPQLVCVFSTLLHYVRTLKLYFPLDNVAYIVKLLARFSTKIAKKGIRRFSPFKIHACILYSQCKGVSKEYSNSAFVGLLAFVSDIGFCCSHVFQIHTMTYSISYIGIRYLQDLSLCSLQYNFQRYSSQNIASILICIKEDISLLH